MSDGTVTFKLELKEMASGTLREFRGTSREVFTGVDRDIYGTKKGLMDLDSQPVKLNVDSSALRQAHDDVEGLHKKMGSFGEMAGEIGLGELAERSLERAVDFAKDQLKDVFGGGMEAGLTKMELNVMAGDGAGKEMYEGTKKYISESMFGPELFQDEKMLLGYGESAKDILTDMKQFGDISMGNPAKLDSLSEALGKVRLYGHFSMLEMRQLATTGFNPIDEMARATGKSVDYFTDMVNKGTFSLGMYKQAIAYSVAEGGRFHDMMAKEMLTPGGKYHQAMTNIEVAKEELGLALMPTVGKLLDSIKPMIDGLPDKLEEMQPAIEHVIEGFNDMLPNIEAFGSGLADIIKPIGGVVFSDEVKDMAKSVLDAATTFFDIAKPAIELFGETLKLGAGSIGKDIQDITDWLHFFKHGDLPENPHASGTVNAITQIDFLSHFIPGEFKWISKVTDIGLASKHNDMAGHDLYKNQSFWAPKHDYTTNYTGYHGAMGLGAAYGNGTVPKDVKNPANTLSNSTDAIASGGRRPVVINIKSFVDHMTNNYSSIKEGKDDIGRLQKQYEEMFLRVVESVNSVM